MKSPRPNEEGRTLTSRNHETGSQPAAVEATDFGENPGLQGRDESEPCLYESVQTDTDRGAPRILVAEDDGDMRNLMGQLLRRDGYEVVECPNGVGLLDYLSTFLGRSKPERFDLIISDIRMPGLSGLEVVGGLHRQPDFPPTILMTAFGDAEIHAEAEEIGVAAMFDKPFDMHELLAKVHETVPLPGAVN
jgi:CheY-like chemotaxis protein